MVGAKQGNILSHYVMVGKTKTHYLCAGQGSPLLLLHGGGYDAREWRKNILPFSQEHRVYAPDFPGFGGTDENPEPYRLPSFVNFLRRFMEAVGVKRASMLGSSVGGGVALALALESPEIIEKLALAGTLGLGRDTSLTSKFLGIPFFLLDYLKPPRPIPRGLREKWGYSPDGIAVPPDLLDERYRAGGMGWKRGGLVAIRFQGRITDEMRKLPDRLSEVRVPTFILWGEKDLYLPLSHAYYGHEKIAGSRLHIFWGCGHAPMRERTEEFNQIVLDFLREGAE